MQSISRVKIQKIREKKSFQTEDALVIEEPLEIRIGYGKLENRLQKSLSVTMRTPGNDFELAIGFLFTEGIIHHKDDILKVEYVPTFHQDSKENIVKLELSPKVDFEPSSLERNFYTIILPSSFIDQIKISDLVTFNDSCEITRIIIFHRQIK